MNLAYALFTHTQKSRFGACAMSANVAFEAQGRKRSALAFLSKSHTNDLTLSGSCNLIQFSEEGSVLPLPSCSYGIAPRSSLGVQGGLGAGGT